MKTPITPSTTTRPARSRLWATAIASLIALNAAAQSHLAPAVTDWQACKAVTDAAQRLACFDQWAARQTGADSPPAPHRSAEAVVAHIAIPARQAAALPARLVCSAGVYAAEAGGGVLVDVDGNSFIDLGSGIAVTTVGNAAPAVVARASEQLTRFTHTCFLATPYEGYLEVAERLNALTPGDHVKRTALFSTGAEAVENAVKYARAATGRPAVVVFDHAFHGRSLLAMTMTAKNQPYKKSFGPFAPEVYRAPMAYPYRWPSGPDNCAAEAFEMFAQLVDAQLGADAVAAVVVEPIQGEGGFIVPAAGFLPRVAEFCRDRGILLVADEVQTGIARTGAWFACEHEGLVPDLITTAKGLAGGLPLAAVTGRAEVMDAAHQGGIGGTYAGNPVACAAALGVFEEIESAGLIERARTIGELMVRELRAIAATTGGAP